ncbi:hypothetical protein IWX78_002193 [Mycetocola sp. CAN_C7]|uniref:BtrH N-terminal domain-containing protein n=1 Tax=Mycetocola sp. CAN_C7 TaxID=2787724 RepID=UPI0018CA295B
MTQRHSAKKLIRARMSRTGESYTTAFRRLQSEREHHGHPDAVSGYPSFGAASHGPSALARHLLAVRGIGVSEPMAFGLGGGVGFLYAVFEYRAVSHPLLTIVAQHHPKPWLESVAEHLRLDLSTTTSSGPASALTKLDASLDAGSPAWLTVGRGHLAWHEATSDEEAADPYPIVVAGRSAGRYLIDDTASDPHLIPADRLATAWAAHRKGRFGLTTISSPVSVLDIGHAVRSAIAMTTAHLTGPVLGNSFDVNIGVSGMERLLADLEDEGTKRGWVRRFGSAESFAAGMARLAECLTWSHTAPAAGRPLYAEFLDEAGPVSGMALGPAAETARDAGAVWATIADLAADATDPGRTITELAVRVRSVLVLERRLAAELGSALDAV